MIIIIMLMSLISTHNMGAMLMSTGLMRWV